MGGQRRCASRGQEPLWEKTAGHTQNLSRREVENEMDIAKAVADQPARNQSDWSCGLTAGKEGNYQRNSKTKRKRRRYVPADRRYHLQGQNPFQ